MYSLLLLSSSLRVQRSGHFSTNNGTGLAQKSPKSCLHEYFALGVFNLLIRLKLPGHFLIMVMHHT